MRRGSCRPLAAALSVLAIFAIDGLGAAVSFARVAPTHSTASPRCLGRPATIVGHGAVHGTGRADVIVASGGADRIVGGGGNDRICAGGGDDTIEGGVGSDRIEAGFGDDEVIGGNGSDLVLAGKGADEVIGKRGNDLLYGEAGTDFLASGLGDDVLDGGAGDGDEVIGGVGNDQVAGGAGNGDVLEGDFGNDSIDGGTGLHDVVSYALAGQSSTSVEGAGVEVDLAAGIAAGHDNEGDDTLSGVEDVVGTPFADRIRGGAEPDALYGGAGTDEIVGVGPGDGAAGGAGTDLCREVEARSSCELETPRNTVFISEAEYRRYLEELRGTPTFEVELPGGPGAGSLIAIVEHGTSIPVKTGMQVHVFFAADAFVVVEGGMPMAAGEGCALLTAESARCPVATTPTGLFLDGGEGADVLAIESSVPATVSARLVGGNGVDTLIGGAGDDDLDPTIGYPAGDSASGGPGDDVLTDGSILDGQSGSDLLIASACGETIEGGAGIDSISFARSQSGVEATIGGSASAYPGVSCGPFATQIRESIETIEGSAHDDVLIGDGAANELLGRGGDDLVEGAGGDDFLVGGGGVDSLRGDRGADRLYARDGVRDQAIDCGSIGAGGSGDPPNRGDVDVADPNDPAATDCRDTGAGSRR